MVQHEVSDRVGALDGVRVAVEGLEEPRVLVGNELAGLLIGPELAALALSQYLHIFRAYLVLVVGVKIDAALLGTLPVCRNALVDVRLVDNLGDQLRAVAACVRVGGRKLAAENGIFAASRN